MAVGQQRDEQSLEQSVLAHDHAADFEQHGLANLAGVGVVWLDRLRRGERGQGLGHGERSLE